MKILKINCKLLIIILCFNNSVSTKSYNITKQNQLINYIPTFESKENISLIYNQIGQLICKIIIKSMQYSNNIQTIYLVEPVAILFDKNHLPIWNIQANKAKIINNNNNNIMHLFGNVKINNLKKNSYLQSIKTNEATINLITYDISSNDMITIYGTHFRTTAMNMKGNLHTKTTELSLKVQTVYETKNSKNNI